MANKQHTWLQRWQIKRQSRALFKHGVGATMRRWPITTDWPTLVTEAEQWLRARIAQTATPNGIDHCQVLVRLAHNGQTVAWVYRSPVIHRQNPTDGLAALSATLSTLDTNAYPTATTIEVHLISLGDLMRHAQQHP